MGFSIFQFNKRKVQNLMFGENAINLNCGDLGLLNEIVDKYNSLPKYDINNDGKLFVWINYEVLMNDFPILSMNIGTYRNNCRKLEKLGLIEKVDLAVNINGDCKKKTFFRPTEMTLGLITTEEDIKAELEAKQGLKPVKVIEPKTEVKEVEVKEMTGEEAFDPNITLTKKQVNDYLSKNQVSMDLEKDIQKVIEATGVTSEEAKRELNITKSKDDIKNVVQYTIGTIRNKQADIKPVKETKETNDNMDKLEAMLLGYESFSDDELSEVLKVGNGNYISNNKKRFKS